VVRGGRKEFDPGNVVISLERRPSACRSAAARRSACTVLAFFTPTASRYPTIQISAIVNGMAMKEWIFWPRSGARNAASMSMR